MTRVRILTPPPLDGTRPGLLISRRVPKDSPASPAQGYTVIRLKQKYG
jgi:hypothetical protein